ncbi:hypothetical protein MKX01_037285 [Papaver californicum]|nr:hypothetical protein MKX01_037285 [Papaver californicum]
MASVSAPPFPAQTTYPDSNTRNFSFRNLNKFSIASPSSPLKKFPTYPYNNFRVLDSTLICRCQKRPSDPPPPEDYVNRRWDSGLQDVIKSVIKKFDDYMNSIRNPENNQNSNHDLVMEKVTGLEGEEWDWDRWKKHFEDVEEQEKIVAVLKSQLNDAVNREEFEDAAKLKVAIAAIAANDTVGKVITCLNRAVEEERYGDAALMRDNAGAGLIGWWAGISKNSDVPYGRIIRISAEHGRYVARSYSPRHLATAAPGVPLFEVFFTISGKGEYKQQAVYLKRGGQKSVNSPIKFSKSPDPIGGSNTLNKSIEGKNDLSAASTEDVQEIEDRDNDSDMSDEVTGFPNILRDMIPGVKVTVLKVTAPGKVDRDLISKVIEQIMEEEEEDEGEEEEEDEEEEKDVELLDLDIDDEAKAESNQDQDEIEMNADSGVISDIISEERNELAVKVVIGGIVQNLSSSISSKALLRVPARLDKTGRLSFSFTIEKDESELDASGKGKPSLDKMATLRGPRSIDTLMSDLAKSVITKEKIPMKVLKDVGEFINLTLNQAQNRQLLSGTTVFNRIQIPASTDLLSGLYIGSHGLYTSEVIQLRRKFGQWQYNGANKNPQDLEFYEYVEALKLIGDSHVPAGQVAFRAKVGRQYQLPHKGIIPDEFGVVARYKGQGRLAEPGVKNPRWVDGELVVLDGKFIRGGPVVGFVYWAPEYHFLVFFHRLRLPK